MKAHKNKASVVKLAAAGTLILSASALYAGPTTTVIFSEIPGSPTSVAPGMLDLAGQPIAPLFFALFDLTVSPDGSQWVLRADTDAPTTHDQVLYLNSGGNLTVLGQDGRPVPGSTTGELWDFFDTDFPAAFNEAGDLAFSGRARPSTSIKEKIMKVVGGSQSIFATESSPLTGLSDIPANPTGDELFGNSINIGGFLNDGKVFASNTPIQNCSSLRYPAVFLDTVGFAQSGVTHLAPPNDNEVWDNLSLGDSAMTPDGQHWFAIGDTENPNTTLDGIFAVNNNKIVQENTLIAGTTVTAVDIFFARMLPNGDWFVRGDDNFPDNDWALKGNGTAYTLVAKTGDPITTGATENWGAVFTAFNGNTNGDWVLAGNTNNPDILADSVLVLNGTEVIARENDPVDVNGNGKFDDDAFIGNNNSGVNISGFNANDVFITNDGDIYLIVTLRNSANTVLGDAFLKISSDVPVCVADIAPPGGNGTVDVDDLILVINSWGTCPKGEDCPADITGNNEVDVDDLLVVINAWGDC